MIAGRTTISQGAKAGERRVEYRTPLSAAALSAWPPIAVVVAWSAVFIKRTEFFIGGKRYFSLFDDAMISMRYAQNLADGHGLRWNTTGAPVEGFTNLLWTLWMALLHLLPGTDSTRSLYVSATGVIILVLNVVLARAVARRVLPGSSTATAVAGWFAALYYPVLYWTLRGMEVGALALLTLVAVLLALRIVESPTPGDAAALAVALLAAILTRTDAIIPAAIISAWLVWRLPARRRVQWAGGAGLVLAAGLAAQLLLSRLYYGSWLPNTYYLKVTQISLGTRLHRGLAGLASIGILELYVPVTLLGLYFLYVGRAPNPAMVLLAALFAGQCAYSVYVGGDAWEANQLANRYISTEALPLLIGAAVALQALRTAPAVTRARLLFLGVLPVLAVLAARIPDWLPGASMQLGRLPREWAATRIGIPLMVVLALAVFAVLARRSASFGAFGWAFTAVTAVVLVLAVSGRDVTYWAQHNAFLQQDTDSARLGVAVKAATAPGASVAFSAAGASAYFADRFAIDEGGLSDPVIAHEAPKSQVFIPGHDKYDYHWSVDTLRPDLVIAVGATTDADRREIRSWGYQQVTPWLFAKASTDLVNRGLLGPVAKYARG